MFLLKSERLTAQVGDVGDWYQAPRFDWAGIVRQIILDEEISFLSEESVSMTSAKNGGIGIIGSFEPAPEGYFSNMSYQAEQTADGEVIFQGENDKIKCVKKLSLTDHQLQITHQVQNLSRETVAFGEYNHNFMLIGEYPFGPDYQITFPASAQLTGRKEGHYNRLVLNGWVLKVAEPFGETGQDALIQLELAEKEGGRLPYTWELLHRPTGYYVREQDDFSIWKYQFWCRKDTACSEIFIRCALHPAGEVEDSVTWKRTYSFGRKQEEDIE